MNREILGKMVRDIWVAIARERGTDNPSNLIEWEDLDEENKEIDRIIGTIMYNYGYMNGLTDAKHYLEVLQTSDTKSVINRIISTQPLRVVKDM